MKQKIAGHLYRTETRALLQLICEDFEWEADTGSWEQQALNALKSRIPAKNDPKHKEINKRESLDGRRLEFQWEIDVATAFYKMLKVACKAGHKIAIDFLKKDETGLALSLIMVHQSASPHWTDKGSMTSWGWKCLEFDGFHLDDEGRYFLTEMKSSSAGVGDAWKQLQVRAGVLDNGGVEQVANPHSGCLFEEGWTANQQISVRTKINRCLPEGRRTHASKRNLSHLKNCRM